MIAIYHDNETQTLANIVESIEQASKWVGCSVSTLYRSLHLNGVMSANGYIIERIEDIEEEKINDQSGFLPVNTYYVKYKDNENGFTKEHGSLYGNKLSEFTIEGLNEDIKENRIKIIEYKTTKNKGVL